MTTQAMPTGPEWFGHPRGLFVCFATEMWERFSFYGMKYLLVLFLVQHHLFSDGEALRILGAYAALVYAMPLLGGIVSDRYLGQTKAVKLGGILLVLGHCAMAFEGVPATQDIAGEVVRDDSGHYRILFCAGADCGGCWLTKTQHFHRGRSTLRRE